MAHGDGRVGVGEIFLFNGALENFPLLVSTLQDFPYMHELIDIAPEAKERFSCKGKGARLNPKSH